MHEIDFLPNWYPELQRRRRWVIAQAWLALGLILVISGVGFTKRLQVSAARKATAQTEAQISLSRQQLVQLGEKLKYEEELRRQDRIVARLGVGIETTRLLSALHDAMTPEMALTKLSLETEERPRITAVSYRDPGTADRPADMDRRLKVVVDGVAPTEIQAVTMMGNLMKVGCFENVAIQLSEGKTRQGHIARDFEVTFDLNLNPPAEAKP